MRIVINYNKKKCIACNYCINQNPIIWKSDFKDGKPILLNSIVKNGIFILITDLEDFELNSKISQKCPTKAIQIIKK